MTIGRGLGFQNEPMGVVHDCRMSLRVWYRAGGSTNDVVKGEASNWGCGLGSEDQIEDVVKDWTLGLWV